MREKADTDQGWFKVSQDLNEAIGRSQLTANEFAICFWVLGHTYGVRTKKDGEWRAQKFTPFNANRVALDIGRDPRGIHRSLRSLLGRSRRVLRVNERGEIGFNTRLTEWPRVVFGRSRDWNGCGQASVADGRPHGTGVRIDADRRPHGQGRASASARTRARAEGENREIPPTPGGGEGGALEKSFNAAWDAYPEHRKGPRARALHIWRRLNPSLELVAVILAAIKAQGASAKWAENGGQYVPRFDRWLRNERWRDKLEPAAPKAPSSKTLCCVCGVRPRVERALVCADCAWCVTCDLEGRDSKKDPSELTPRGHGEMGVICRACAAKGAKT